MSDDFDAYLDTFPQSPHWKNMPYKITTLEDALWDVVDEYVPYSDMKHRPCRDLLKALYDAGFRFHRAEQECDK